ncbi:helix-turn-helix transcriptional regulator [Pseudomonas piscis]|uniref:Helix-turn-helix transcriptional regulator n=1 Tax=Pseudomonas piscis TaxID=2614538 RepID=A0ABY9NLQ4_9PSED|nr:helix-turn-helix transcriptional regulator [Pseudomonas piscis]WMN19240.1 helix-turn-helix transcriptional regulator [Pseudomonas piscis]
MTMSTQTIAEMIASGREKLGLNQSELARRLQVSPQAVQAWESGRAKPRVTKLQDIASALGIPSHQLVTASGLFDGKLSNLMTRLTNATKDTEATLDGGVRVWDDATPLEEDEVYVPLLKEVELSAGSGRFTIEERPTSSLRFSKKDLRKNGVQFSNAKCVSVSGNSMFPVLRNGATVGVNVGKNKLTDIMDGEMYAINHNGQLRVKQVFRIPNGVRLRSFNRDEHPDEDYTFQQLQDEQVSIVGHVFWWGMFA